MRIAFVVYGSLENVSGGFIYDRALVAALVSLGHTVDVIGLPWVGYLRAVAGSLIGAPAGAAIGSHDIVIEDELAHPSLFRRGLGRAVAPTLTPPLPRPARVALVHNLRSRQPRESLRAVKARVERRYLRDVDALMAVCQSTLDDARALAGGPAGGPGPGFPTLVVHPGRDHVAPDVDNARVAARAAQPGPLRILHVASGVPAKGLDRLLDACALALAEPRGYLGADFGSDFDFTLDVVGSWPRPRWRDAMERRIAARGLASRVRLHGELAGRALHDVFRRSHVLALPSDREAYSLACLEALGFGLPVLATSVGGLGELVTDGCEGFLLEPRDVTAWARMLRHLATDRGALAAAGCAALARYRAHRTWREVAISVEEFLRAVRPRPAVR
jgi:glycosyltransferase involved in cell wall biosynthesis